MMTVEPTKRITIAQVLKHPWLKDLHMQETINSLIPSINNENIPPSNIYRRKPEDVYPPPKRARLNA